MKLGDTPKGPLNTWENLSLKAFQNLHDDQIEGCKLMSKVPKEHEHAKQIRKSFTQNTEIGFWKQPGHPLTLKTYLHAECCHPKCLACKKEEEIKVAIKTCF